MKTQQKQQVPQQGGKLPQQQESRKQKGKGTRKSPSIFQALFGLLPSFAIFTSTLATFIRLFSGFSVLKPLGKRPEKYLKLYEYEGNPNCRLVREALATLDLECIILPCPKGGKRWRPEASKIGGKEKFPLLVDENTDQKIYGARKIVPYLFKTYGTNRIPFVLRHPLVGLSSFLASLARGFAGVRRKKGIQETTHDPTSIELYSYEASPHCRLVREVLTELEIAYLLHNVGKKSPSRKAFVTRSGKMMVPYLIDNNKEKDWGLFESRDIIRYLETTYS